MTIILIPATSFSTENRPIEEVMGMIRHTSPHHLQKAEMLSCGSQAVPLLSKKRWTEQVTKCSHAGVKHTL